MGDVQNSERQIVGLAGRSDNHGMIDRLIDSLPFEVHFPGMEFCGPGTRLEERLAAGQRGVNLLDRACLQHDLAYAKKGKRTKADRDLAERAFSRLLAIDADPHERTAALVTTCCMVSKIGFDKLFSRIKKLLTRNGAKKKCEKKGKSKKQPSKKATANKQSKK